MLMATISVDVGILIDGPFSCHDYICACFYVGEIL